MSLASILTRSAAANPTRTAIAAGDTELDYATVDLFARMFAGALRDLGVQPGEHVALVLPNVPQFTVAYFGCHYAGNPVVPLNVLLTAEELAYHLDDSQATTVVAWDLFLPAVQQAAGARTVIAVDIDARKLEWARGFGATHTVDAGTEDVVERIKELTGGFGADVVVEAVGRPETYRQAFFARDLAGTLVQVGVPDPSMLVELPMIELFGRGGALKSSWYGDCLPARDFPILIDLYLAGRLDLDGFVSETISLDGVEEAFARMQRGEVLRSVVVL